MSLRLTVFLAFIVSSGTALSQSKIPHIRASSLVVDVRDGKEYNKGAWKISPELKPDVYTTSGKNNRVTFYTDLDSISFLVRPNRACTFLILVNGKDSALTEIRYVPTFLETLKASSSYNYAEHRAIPGFTYQAAGDSNLTSIRKGFNLDSVAGQSNDYTQIINVMHWVHNLIPHDGMHPNPAVKNALNLVAYCKKEQTGLNCRGLATVLNECYLSLGFRSRFVTCLPKDTSDVDCHVINMVFSRQLNKWIWIDPTNDAYVMNAQGELQSIEEVRNALVQGKTLIVNPDANWNHKFTVLKKDYLYRYMAKNLYRLECPVKSEFDTETRKAGKTIEYVDLLALESVHPRPGRSLVKEPASGTVLVTFRTNNPSAFWAAPKDLPRQPAPFVNTALKQP